MPTFGEFERRMLSYFSKGTEFFYNGRTMKVLESDKPTCSQGEPKTDIYVLASDGHNQEEIKISPLPPRTDVPDVVMDEMPEGVPATQTN